MSTTPVIGALSALSRDTCGIFRGGDAGISRKQLLGLRRCGLIDELHPDIFRMTAVAPTSEQLLRAALMWAGDGAYASGTSAGERYRLDGVRASLPEINVPIKKRLRSDSVVVHRVADRAIDMVRIVDGIAVAGPEATMVALGGVLEPEQYEIACEDARRRRLTSVPALRSYMAKYGRDRPGAAALRRLIDDLDPIHPARSALEVKTRRLLVAHGITDFVREFPLAWNGRTYRYDFGFPTRGAILETNGRRWHDDATDYEHDHEKWSVPGRHGYRIVLATWAKVTREPHALLAELTATLAA